MKITQPWGSPIPQPRQLPWPLAVSLDILLAPVLLLVALWVGSRQTDILRDGARLTDAQCELARALGVTAVERVRIVVLPVIPMPLPWWARRAAQRAGWISPHIVGMTLGHGIVLREDCSDDAGLLAHELVHVSQVERLGGVAGFLRHYLRECVWPGYPFGVLEREARAAEVRGSTQTADVIPYLSTAAQQVVPGRADSSAAHWNHS